MSRSNDPQEGINMAEHSTGMMYGEYLQVNKTQLIGNVAANTAF
jgi:hypothetical protein